MLVHIYIKNIALIDEITIDFNDHLNILTGETGAGKSILIDSINFALGERGTKERIRSGEESALVELLFHIENESVLSLLKEFGIELEEDNYLLISRGINQSGRSICRMNGQTVTIGMLRQVSTMLIDVHGQHAHQSLLDVSKHIELLDQFGGDRFVEMKQEVFELYGEYKSVRQKISELSGGDDRERERKIDLLQFQIDEINQAKLKLGEDQVLESQQKIMGNAERLNSGLEQAYSLLQEGSGQGISACDALGQVLKIMRDLCPIDLQLSTLYEMMESIEAQLEEAVRDIRNYKDNIEHDPEQLNDIQNRLDLIYNLKRKYGSSIEEILEYKKQIEQELAFIQNSEEELNILEKRQKDIEQKMHEKCDVLSSIRKKQADIIKNKIENVLHELQMTQAQFEIAFDKKNSFTENGWDQVEFLISGNPGEPLKPLAKIASGGEMSRVMLALKTVLADIDKIGTLIFDEIDTGVSGRAAQKVAEKLALIGNCHQIICITHLPQIASMADRHYLIEKTIEDQKTTTNIYPLSPADAINELARLIGGAQITDTTLQNAEEMKMMAQNIKKSL